jgi:arylsulfatase A-like enzyme
LSVHYTAPHWPWETRGDEQLAREVRDNIFHLHGGNIETYRRMIHHMDEGIGWIVDALRAKGLLNDTLIVFTSDNGGERFSDNWPLVGGKMDLTEGGIRVPWIAHWPAVIEKNRVSTQHCLTMDWSATMLDIGGAPPRADYPLDGVSLLPMLSDASAEFPREMYWRMKHRDQRALRNTCALTTTNTSLTSQATSASVRISARASRSVWARCASIGSHGTPRCLRFRKMRR